MPWDHPYALGPIGATGGSAANQMARDADVVIAIGTRLSDFTTMSKTAFQNPDVRFRRDQRVRVRRVQARGDSGGGRCARGAGGAGVAARAAHATDAALWCEHSRERVAAWHATRSIGRAVQDTAAPFAQAEVIGARQRRCAVDQDVVVCAAGSLPGDLHKLWRRQRAEHLSPRVRLLVHGLRDRRRPWGEDGGSVARGVRDGRRRLLPDDGAGDRHVRAGRLQADDRAARQSAATRASAACRARSDRAGSARHIQSCRWIWPRTPRRLAQSCIKPTDRASLMQRARGGACGGTHDRDLCAGRSAQGRADYDSWWDVPVAEVSEQLNVQTARGAWEKGRTRQRYFL